VLFEWRSEDRVGGAERGGGEPERSSGLGEKRDEWECDVRSIGGRDCLRDLPKPRALVRVANECDVMIYQVVFVR
jgi:hypothetical protein